VVFGPNGRFLRTLTLTTNTAPQPSSFLLGLDFIRRPRVLVIDFGNARVLNVDSSPAPRRVHDRHRRRLGTERAHVRRRGECVRLRSSGASLRTGPNGGTATPWVTDARLGTTGVPPFAPTGSPQQGATALFVANTE